MNHLEFAEINEDVKQVSHSNKTVCIVTIPGKVKCWGSNYSGILGTGELRDMIGNLPNDMQKVRPVQLPHPVTQISVSRFHVCALMRNKKAICWGSNDNGKLGIESTVENLPGGTFPPLAEVKLPENIIQLASGNSHTCALLENKKVKCWGNNIYGQLGLPRSIKNIGLQFGDMTQLSPVKVGEDVEQISAGENQTCALTTTNKIKCWGL
jgi:alpha-tubulin suppressor-like RCC1 family protein